MDKVYIITVIVLQEQECSLAAQTAMESTTVTGRIGWIQQSKEFRIRTCRTCCSVVLTRTTICFSIAIIVAGFPTDEATTESVETFKWQLTI